METVASILASWSAILTAKLPIVKGQLQPSRRREVVCGIAGPSDNSLTRVIEKSSGMRMRDSHIVVSISQITIKIVFTLIIR